MGYNKKIINTWLFWGTIILVILLLIWFITFEYFNIFDSGIMNCTDKIAIL